MKNWEIKDRTYMLTGNISPLTYIIKSKGILWFDEKQGLQREIRYSPNQKSLFRDEQDDYARMEHVVFENGVLSVPRTKTLLQQLLSKYHPEAGKKWAELDPQKEAVDDVEMIEIELEAMRLVQELEIEHLEAILRTEVGSDINTMSSKEIKRDCYLFAKNDPELFIEIANDEDIKLRNLANRAVETGIVNLTDDNTVFKWASNNKKIMTIPFDEHPYTAFARFLKTDEGVDVMKAITKKLS
jgi:hypothetical protein